MFFEFEATGAYHDEPEAKPFNIITIIARDEGSAAALIALEDPLFRVWRISVKTEELVLGPPRVTGARKFL